jgi:hypothetical protein
MCAEDVTATLDLALSASGLDHVTVVHRLAAPTKLFRADPLIPVIGLIKKPVPSG